MRIKLIILVTIISALLLGCTKEKQENILNLNYSEIENKSKNTTVRFYMWGGSATINKWVDEQVGNALKSKHNITLERVPMDASIFVNKLINEKIAGKGTGSIDLVWINGENFKNAMEAGVLFGPFLNKLPSYKYIDPEAVTFDFGYPVNGYESPYGRAQFVFEHDAYITPTPPKDISELKKWIIANPGRFTYPQPPDFTGSAFIRQMLYATTGGHDQYMKGFDQALFDKKAPQLWTYLNEIKPYLWQKGKAYPKDSAMLDTLFARGEVDFNMSYHPTHAYNKMIEGAYPKSVRTFVLNEGAIFNTHFVAIPFNSPNKAGAIVLAELLLSPELQYSKNQPDLWGDFTALNINKLPVEMKNKFENIDLGISTLPLSELADKAVPEIPSAYLEKLEKGWKENVLRN